MLSNHFPTAYTHSYSWLVLVALMAIGAWIRLFFNLRHAGRNVWWIPLTAALGIAAVAVAIRPTGGSGGAVAAGTVSFAQAHAIVEQRCVPCHSAHPTRVAAAPLGIELDTAAQIHAQAAAIQRVAVDSQLMPLGNATGMTPARARRARRLDPRRRVDQVGSRRAGDRLGRLPVRRAARGGARAGDRGRVPAAAAAGEPDHPRPLERRVVLDPVRRARRRLRPGERDVLPEPRGSCSSIRAGSARRRSCSRTGRPRSRARPGCWRGTTSRRSWKALDRLGELGRKVLWEGAQPLRAAES